MASRFKFKVWDNKKKLLSRPGTVNFVKGELVLPDSVILQFTGFTDMMEQEIYEDDILLIGSKKYKVFWNETEMTWQYKSGRVSKKLNKKFAVTTVRGYNAHERKEDE